jgi:hypothetical protein
MNINIKKYTMRKFTTLIFITFMGIVLWGQTQVPGSDPNSPIYYKNGKGGISINNPLSKLHINNGDNSYGAILAQAKESNFQLYTKTLTTQPTNVESFRIGLKYSDDENNSFISFYRRKSTYGGFLGFSTNGKERIRISSNGNIGIGTTIPKAKLDVAGAIHATEIKVEAKGNTADFVFEDNYPLRTLDEIEAFIKKINASLIFQMQRQWKRTALTWPR